MCGFFLKSTKKIIPAITLPTTVIHFITIKLQDLNGIVYIIQKWLLADLSQAQFSSQHLNEASSLTSGFELLCDPYGKYLFAFVKCIVILFFGHSGTVVSAITSQQEFPKGACVGSLPQSTRLIINSKLVIGANNCLSLLVKQQTTDFLGGV